MNGMLGVRMYLRERTTRVIGHEMNELQPSDPAFEGFSLCSRGVMLWLEEDAVSFTGEFNTLRWKFMWLPDWLYERLPFLYVAAGGMCLWFLGTSFATTLSAVVLTVAALLTYIR